MDKTRKIIIFSKAPIAGQVKTRMIPALGRHGATELHKNLLYQTVKMAAESGLASVDLYCTPDTRHPDFQTLKNIFNIQLCTQSGHNLGERMFNAIADKLPSHPQVILIGTDCPSLNLSHLRAAFNSLRPDRPLAIAPAHDGGYVLIAATSIANKVFEDIKWGSEQVYQQTRDNLNRLNCQHTELEKHYDLDRPEDLQHLTKQQKQQLLPREQ